MSRSIEIDELPPLLQRRARAIAATLPESAAIALATAAAAENGIELGPDSPLRGRLTATGRQRRRAEDREFPIQRAIIDWTDDPATLPQFPELKTLYAIPNQLGAGGKQSKGKRQLEGARRKAEGRRKGMPDLCLPAPRRGGDDRVYGALYLEIKDEQGKASPAQRERMAALRAAGNRCEIAMSEESAKAIITTYLMLERP